MDQATAPFLSEQDVGVLRDLRHALHRAPEVSGDEAETAGMIAHFLAATDPDRLVTGLGGHGVAAIYDSGLAGPALMVRAELDALPIAQVSDRPYRSMHPGKAHLCGHDGHMATLAGVALGLGRQRPARGRAILLFQPAEEDGSGAAAVLADPAFDSIAPDIAIALHNMPGIARGRAALVEGPSNCASRSMQIGLSGTTAHASSPDQGLSPMAALCELMPGLTGLGSGGTLDEDFSLVTVTHAAMGEREAGIAPGSAELWATLRTLTDARMGELVSRAEVLVRAVAARTGLGVEIRYDAVFAHCVNDPRAAAILRQALDDEGVPHDDSLLPMRASEDFGRFGTRARSAMFLLGAGETHPGLHTPDYDFPDELIVLGARVFTRAIRNVLG
ncbi:amidohydrolase [Aurantimonas sp. A2-1-M11]|uniref:amidohydrolase n=1 Tax=Aurantimonas sp. A2-1-M11 TaxID=3113712 RepID=UPI002F945B20